MMSENKKNHCINGGFLWRRIRLLPFAAAQAGRALRPYNGLIHSAPVQIPLRSKKRYKKRSLDSSKLLFWRRVRDLNPVSTAYFFQ